MRDALKNYLSLASGLTEVGRQRAVDAAKALVAQGEATAEQVQSLAEDLVQTSRSNREMVTALVRNEVDKALAKLGYARADEVSALKARLKALESRTAAPVARAATTAPARKAAKPAAKKPAAKKAPAKKPAAKKSPAKRKAPAKKATR